MGGSGQLFRVCVCGHCGNVCVRKSYRQSLLEAQRVCVTRRGRTRRRSINRTCSLEFTCSPNTPFSFFYFCCLVWGKNIWLLSQEYKHLLETEDLIEQRDMQPSSGTHNHDNCVQTQLCGEFLIGSLSDNWTLPLNACCLVQ